MLKKGAADIIEEQLALVNGLIDTPTVVKVEAHVTTEHVTQANQKTNTPEKIVEITNDSRTVTEVSTSKIVGWISTEYGHTINLGNYESARISMKLSVPIGLDIDPETKAEIDRSFTAVDSYLTSRFSEEVKKITQYRDAKK